MYREPAIWELHTHRVKLSTSCNATEGHNTSPCTKGQGTEFEYIGVKWNRVHVHEQRTSLAEWTLRAMYMCVCVDWLNVFHGM